MQPVLQHDFGSGVRLAMWGRGNDCQNFSAVTGDYLPGVRAAEEYFKAPVHVMRVAFKNDGFVDLSPNALKDFKDANGNPQHQIVGDCGSVRMMYQGDVGYMSVNPDNPQPVVIALLNADCPAIFVLDYNHYGKVVGVWFAHAGLNCLVPAKVSDAAKGVSVLDTIVAQREHMSGRRHINFVSPPPMRFFFGGGANKCCYGLDDVTEVRARLEARYGRLRIVDQALSGNPERGPRKLNKDTGKPNSAVDLHAVLCAELDRVLGCGGNARILPLHAVGGACTTCLGDAQDNGNGHAWSNMWHAKEAGGNPRNFTAFAWMP